MPDPIHETIAGSSDPIGTVLGPGTGNSSRQVRDHRLTDATHAVESQTRTGAPIARPLRATTGGQGVVAIISTNGLNTSGGAMGLRTTNPGLTLTGTTAGEAGDGESDGHRSVVVVRVLYQIGGRVTPTASDEHRSDGHLQTALPIR